MTGLADAIARLHEKQTAQSRDVLAAELRDFKPDAELERLGARIDETRDQQGGELWSFGHLQHRVDAYRNRKSQAEKFQQTGVLPDGSRYEPPPAA